MGIRIEIDTDGGVRPYEWDALIALSEKMKNAVPPNAYADAPARRYAPPVEVLVEKTVAADMSKFVGQIIAPEDNPAAGTDTDAALQSAGFGSGNVAGGAAVLAATIAPPAPPAMPPAPPVTATAPAPSGNVQLDKRGLPWDHRIHSGERTQNKDGSWRNKRGLSDGEVERVEAELRAVLGVAAPVVPPPPTPPVSASVAPPAPQSPPGAMGFMQLLPKVTGAIKAGTLTQDAVNAALVEFSLPNLPAIHHRPDLVQPFHDRLFGAA